MKLWTGKIARLSGALGTERSAGNFLEELYRGVEWEVRVGEVLSDSFEVTTGLRQGCVHTFTVALLTVY